MRARPRHPQRAQAARASRAAAPRTSSMPLPDDVRAAAGDRRRPSPRTRWSRRARRPAPPACPRSPTTRGSRPPRSAGAPGVRSARYAGEDATDEENLAKLLREVPADGDRRVRYVCALAYVEPGRPRGGRPRAAARARSPTSRAATAASATTRRSCPTTCDDGRTMAELDAGGEGRDQPPRPRRARVRRKLGTSRTTTRGHRQAVRRSDAMSGAAREHADRSRPPRAPWARRADAAQDAPRVSIVSNAILIVLKLVAGGGHRLDRDHHRGGALEHRPARVGRRLLLACARPTSRPTRTTPTATQKVENLAAAIEGMLILVGAGGDHLRVGPPARAGGSEVESLGVGIAVIGFSARREPRRLRLPLPAGAGHRLAGARGRRRPPAHRRLHLARRARRAWRSSRSPASRSSTRSRRWSWPARSSSPGVRILTRSSRVLVDEALPAGGARRGPPGDRGARRARGGRLPQAARAPRRQPPLHRPARAVPRGHHARARPRAQPRAAGRDPRAAPRRGRADPPRAGGAVGAQPAKPATSARPRSG